jgi:GAF domain-containing protein
MTNEAAIAILLERRGKMYDPAIVDAFIAAHERLMPAETPMHPAAKAVGGARSRERVVPSTHAQPAAAESNASEEVLGITSLARALGGDASLPDVGALSWMMFKQVLPCCAMGLFVPDEPSDTVVGCYAAGHHASMIRGLQVSPGDGIVGWVGGHRRPAVNAEPALDFGLGVATMDPPLLSALAIPLVHDGTLVAVLSLYATTRGAFSDDHARLLELMAPKLAASIASVGGRPDFTIDASRPVGAKPKATSELSIVKRAAEWRPRVAAGSGRS